VVATITIIADMARAVAGPHADVQSLLPPGADPHIYDPTPSDAERLHGADLLLRNGLNLEGWIDKLLASAAHNVPLVTVTRGITPLTAQGHQGAVDPHAWMDPQLARVYVRNIAQALVALDPAHTTQYLQRAATYDSLLLALDAYIAQQMARVPAQQRVLITSHDAFRYFAQRYHLEVAAVLGPTTLDAEAEAGAMEHIYTLVRQRNIRALFVESTLNPRAVEQMAADLEITIGGKLYADALGPKGSGAETYLALMRQNTDLMVSGLLGQATPTTAAAQATAQAQADADTADAYGFLTLMAGLFALSLGVVVWRLRPRPTGPQPTGPQALHVDSLTVAYGARTVLHNLHLTFEPGRVIGLLGPNGSGKSTLLKSILGLVRPQAGQVRLAGQPLRRLLPLVSYVPQRDEIDWQFPASVYDVVAMGRFPHLPVLGRLRPADRQKIDDALDLLELRPLARRHISELSGGQQQRVFLARALCQEAQVYLLDEPFVGVDALTEAKIMDVLRLLARQQKTVVVIHHDLSKVERYFDEIVLLASGAIVAQGPPAAAFTDTAIRRAFGGPLHPPGPVAQSA